MITKRNSYYTSRKILVLYFIVLLIIPYIILSTVQIAFYANSIKTETIRTSAETLEQINLTVSKQVNKVENLITAIATSSEYKAFLRTTHTQKYGFQLQESYLALQEMISNNTREDIQVKSVVVVNNQEQVFSFGDAEYFDFTDIKESDWYDSTVNAKGKLCWFGKKGSLIAARKLYNIDTFREMGVMYVEVLNDFFDVRNSKDNDGSLMYIIGADKKPLCSMIPKGSGYSNKMQEQIVQTVTDENCRENEIHKIGSERFLKVVSSSGNDGWIVAKVIPAGKLLSPIIKTCIIGGIILLCCFTLFFILFLIVYNRISHPLQYLIGLVNEIKAEPDIDIDLGKYPCYEAMQISSELVNITKEKETINKELQEISQVKTKIELEKLQAEINPHFIYNTLTTIKYMALQNHQKEISDMVTALVRILRSTVNRDGQFITVGEEVENLRQYIYIQKILYNDKIKFLIDKDEEADKCYIPNFILQPLVENAVIHGLNPKGCEGKVNISVGVQDKNIIIEVKDDGVGVEPEKVRREDPVHKKGAGLTNIALPGIMKKIEILYGERGSFNIEPIMGGGTLVTVVLPMKFAEQEMGQDD